MPYRTPELVWSVDQKLVKMIHVGAKANFEQVMFTEDSLRGPFAVRLQDRRHGVCGRCDSRQRTAYTCRMTGEIKLSEMIDALRVELAVAAERGAGEAIRFEVGPVELEVEVAVTKKTTGAAGVEFWVVKAGSERAREDVVTHRIKVTLEPKHTGQSGPLQVSRSSTNEPPAFQPRG